MKKIILFTFLACILCSQLIQAQQQLYHIDSTTFIFAGQDSLEHDSLRSFIPYPDSVHHIIIDTTGAHLWQIGHTLKPAFSDTVVPSPGIMTDTAQPYPANADDGFLMKWINPVINPQLVIWHEYNTDSTHAGGFIEFSTDSGQTWLNVASCGNLYAINSYAFNSTLSTGQQAFTGNSYGQIKTTYQFTNCYPEKSTATNCFLVGNAERPLNVYLRFRFLSDTTINTILSGWKIDSIMVVSTICTGAVKMVNAEKLLITPNPSTTGIFNFPELQDAHDFTITIYDSRGVLLRSVPYQNHLDLNGLPLGLYFYQVRGSKQYYSGKLLYE